MPRQSLANLRLLLPPLLLLLPAMLVTALTNSELPAPDGDRHCCLPVKWHSRMLKTNDKLFRYLRTGATEQETSKPLQLDVLVNHRRPRFELRKAGGDGSVVFWRGHMWLFKPSSRWPRILNSVPSGYKPSGGFAPLFFRCLARGNGFEKVNETHYRMTELNDTPVGRRLGLSTVTDIFVSPIAVEARGGGFTCQLGGFSVTSTYPKHVEGKGLAILRDTDTYRAESPSAPGWPDASLTERTKAYRRYYQNLLRSGGIRVNRPHLTVPLRDKWRLD